MYLFTDPVPAPARPFERLSLFDDLEPEVIAGLTYRPEFITGAEEKTLAGFIDREPWNMDYRRRRQAWGGYYEGLTGMVGPDGTVLPDWLMKYADRLKAAGHFRNRPDHVVVNDYQPGQGIGSHIDRQSQSVDTVAILSLLSPVMLDFTRPGYVPRSYWLQPRSLLVLTGEARTLWMHGIAARRTDSVGGVAMPRERRVSVTFRQVRTRQ